MSHYMLWLIAGVVFFALEAVGITGIGLLFAGLGALTIGSIVTIQTDMTPLTQGVIFLAATGLWAILLWKPLQKFRGKPNGNGYKNMVGDTAYVGANGLKKGHTGEVTWSGTIMRAELSEGIESAAPGTQVKIIHVSGNTLIVTPK